MKKKKTLFICLGIFGTLSLALTVFVISRGLYAGEVNDSYFDVYRAEAVEYINSSPEIAEKYGTSPRIKFDSEVHCISAKKRRPGDLIIYVFAPDIPDSIEEFNSGFKTIEFDLTINGDDYRIRFDKDDSGDFFVSSLECL